MRERRREKKEKKRVVTQGGRGKRTPRGRVGEGKKEKTPVASTP